MVSTNGVMSNGANGIAHVKGSFKVVAVPSACAELSPSPAVNLSTSALPACANSQEDRLYRSRICRWSYLLGHLKDVPGYVSPPRLEAWTRPSTIARVQASRAAICVLT